jgi:hypothetical protein
MDKGIELFDAYNIRARLSASIILLAPIAISVFLCLEEVRSLATSAVILIVLLAFANCVPILQRRHRKRKNKETKDRAYELLLQSDNTFDSATKERYYDKLASLDESFLTLKEPDNSDEFKALCKSAVLFLRNRTRDNRLVLEENINYGFCRNLIETKTTGIWICVLCLASVAIGSWLMFGSLCQIPVQNGFAFIADLGILLFWIFGIKDEDVELAALNYARTLVMAIDTLNAE